MSLVGKMFVFFLFFLWTFNMVLAKNIIKIGIILPISKDSVPLPSGEQKLLACMMAINDAKRNYAAQNITIRYTIRDSQGHYGLAGNAAAELASDAKFPGPTPQPVHIIVGAEDNSITQAIGNTVTDYDSVAIGWGADASSLSRGSLYPNIGRVYPSVGYESAALADLCHELYGISRVILISTADIYGEDAVAVWNWRSSNYNFHTIGAISLVPGGLSTNDTQAALIKDVENLAVVDGRIWILLSDDIPAIQNFFRTAAHIFGQNTYFLGNSVLSTPAIFDKVGLSTAFMNVILGGYMGIQHADSDWKVTPAGMDFIKRFQNSTRTAKSSSSGKVTWCSKAVDDTGRSLYNFTIPFTSSSVCLGIDPSYFRPIDINVYTAYIYDATMAAIGAVVDYQQTYQNSHPGLGKQLNFPDDIYGTAIATAMAVTNFTVVGVTGIVQFEAGIGGIPDYGWGDRISGVRFSVVNYQYNNTNVKGIFQRVGTWSTDHKWVPCAMDPLLSVAPLLTGGCTPIQWTTVDGNPPPDRASPKVKYLPNALKGYTIFLSVTCWVSWVAILALLMKYRKTKLLKASQPPMLALILLGMFYGNIRVTLSTANLPTTSLCNARFWLGHLGFTIVPVMLAKTLRVHLVVNSKMKKMKIKTYQVVAFTSALIAVMVLLLILLTPLNPVFDTYYDDYAITGQATYLHYCSTRNPNLDFLLYAYEMLLMVVCIKLCYDIRAVPDAVNESKQIFKVVIVIMVTAAGLFGVLQVLKFDPFAEEIILASGFFICIMSLANYYFWPKLHLMLQGADLDKNFKIVFPAKKEVDENGEVLSASSRAAKVAADTAAGAGAGPTDRQTELLKKYLPKLPKTMDDCRIVMEHLEAHLMVLTQKATGDSNSGSSSHASSSNKSAFVNGRASQYGADNESHMSMAEGDLLASGPPGRRVMFDEVKTKREVAEIPERGGKLAPIGGDDSKQP